VAVAAAAPSIQAYQWQVLLHPNWVEAAVAGAMLLAALAWRRRSIGLAYGAAAALALAIQMHLTALFYLALPALCLWAMGLRRGRFALHTAGTVLVAFAGFAPLAIAPVVERRGSVEGVASSFATTGIGDYLTVLGTALVEVPRAIGETYVERAGVPAWLWIACYVAGALAALAGVASMLREPGTARRSAAALLVLLIAGVIGITAVRSYTSFYLAYFLLPLGSLLAGAGLHRTVTADIASVRRVGIVAAVAIAAMFVAAAIGARAVGRDTHIESRLPGIADLKHPSPQPIVATLATVAARDDLARALCKLPGATLHGELAYALAASARLDFLLHCPARAASIAILGPPQAGPSWTGFAASRAAVIGKRPVDVFRGLAVFDVRRAVHPPAGRPIEPDWYYFELLRDPQPPRSVVLDFTTAPGEAVMVFRLKPFASRFTDYRVQRNGRSAAPALSTYNSDTFVSEGSGPSAWRVEFTTDAPQWVDVHVF
jgi:hypothetical protein